MQALREQRVRQQGLRRLSGSRWVEHGLVFASETGRPLDSNVVGQRVNGVTVDATAIPWLLLSAKSTAAGPDGDRLVNTSYIQRVNTTGGLAPAAAECTTATAGKAAEVPYTADYYFWKPTGKPGA